MPCNNFTLKQVNLEDNVPLRFSKVGSQEKIFYVIFFDEPDTPTLLTFKCPPPGRATLDRLSKNREEEEEHEQH